MPRYKDDDIMWESYINDRMENGEVLEEGLWDRLKAKGAGAKSGLGSIKGRAKGFAQKAVGKAASKLGAEELGSELQSAGKKTTASAKAQGWDAKTKSIVNSHIKKIQNNVNDFQKDMNDLKLFSIENKASKDVKNALQNIFTNTNLLLHALEGGSIGQDASVIGNRAAPEDYKAKELSLKNPVKPAAAPPAEEPTPVPSARKRAASRIKRSKK